MNEIIDSAERSAGDRAKHLLPRSKQLGGVERADNLNLLRIGLAVILTCIGVYYALISVEALPDHRLVRGFNDLVLHAGLFALMGFVVLSPKKWVITRLGWLVALAGGLEIAQLGVEGREPSWSDFFASMAGVVFAATTLFLMRSLARLIRQASRPGDT